MAKTTKAAIVTAHKIEEFAEDLGTLLGSATAKAESWLGQRQQIVKRLTEVRDTASKLLTDLGHQAQSAAQAGAKAYGKRRGRPRASNTGADQAVGNVGGKKRRTMSAKARAAISAAQKARWAKQKAGEKKAK